jgi:hypothetical protein
MIGCSAILASAVMSYMAPGNFFVFMIALMLIFTLFYTIFLILVIRIDGFLEEDDE